MFTSPKEEYVLDLILDSGKFKDYRLLFTKHNFEKHQKNPSKAYYYVYMKDRFLNLLIPTIFKNSECYCPSKHLKSKITEPPKYVIYGVYQDFGTYRTYLKIPFEFYEGQKKIKILTYTPDIRDITEPLCKTKSQALKLFS